MKTKAVRVTSIALVLALAAVSALAAPSRPGVIAHRGVILEAPENTLPAIERAIQLGCAMAEIDIRYTMDKEVVLIHDETVDRTTGGKGRVSELNLAQIRQLDAGAYFGKAFVGTKVPTLREAIELARGKIVLYLDMKEFDPRPAARLVRQMNAQSVVLFRPYFFWTVNQITAVDPKFQVLIDVEDWLGLPGIMELLLRQFPGASFSSGIRNWTKEMLTEARRLGSETYVNVLGPDDTVENLRRAIDMGFDYIQTDYQQRLLGMIRELEKKSDR